MQNVVENSLELGAWQLEQRLRAATDSRTDHGPRASA